MSDLKNILKDIGYFGVGAAAAILETGCKAVKALVRKGAKIIEDNQDTVDEMKQKAKEAGEKIKEAVQELNKTEEAPEAAEVPEVEAPEADMPEVEIPEIETPEVEAPVVPDAIYRTEEPVPAEEDEGSAEEEDEPKPEETING